MTGHLDWVTSSMLFLHRLRVFSEGGSGLFYRSAAHQVKLPLMIGPIRYSDLGEMTYEPPFFRCAASTWLLRKRDSSVCDPEPAVLTQVNEPNRVPVLTPTNRSAARYCSA